MNKTVMNIRYRFIPWFIKPYYSIFVLVFWQPAIWNLIKPSDGIIDSNAHWFHRHSVKCLNKVRGSDSWVMMSLFAIKVRDPYAHISHNSYYWSKKHLFAVHK